MEEVKSVFRRGSEELEQAVEFAHNILKQHPRYAWSYEGGRTGRARIRGIILSVIADREDRSDLFDWRWYFRVWACEVCKERLEYILDFLGPDGEPKPFVKKSPEQLAEDYDRRAKFLLGADGYGQRDVSHS